MAIHVENLGDLAVITCKGRIVGSAAVFKLRDVVLSQLHSGRTNVRTIALDLSEVTTMGGGGLGMLVYLRHWAGAQGIAFKLFSPSTPVVEGLVSNRSIQNFEIASFHEMMDILAHSDRRHELAA
ncbi:MAG: STAS domain-containing protein [Terriglobales bacterium]|jgi:anti-anti-sigma regulatory factor